MIDKIKEKIKNLVAVIKAKKWWILGGFILGIVISILIKC